LIVCVASCRSWAQTHAKSIGDSRHPSNLVAQPERGLPKTPFEDVLIPMGQGPLPLSTIQPGRPVAQGYAGTDLNFPGFRAAPFIYGSQPSNTSSIATSVTADFNNDGKPDLATIQQDGTVNVFLNPGNADFRTWTITSTNDSAPAQGFKWVTVSMAADLNGDGYPDIVALDTSNNAFLVWLNNGDGTFLPVVSYPVSPTTGGRLVYGGIAVGDVNGDGIPDIVAVSDMETQADVTTAVYSVQSFLGDGRGAFITPTTETDIPLNGAFHSFSTENNVKLADIDNDGKLDIVFQYMEESPIWGGMGTYGIASLLGNGNGTFSTSAILSGAAKPSLTYTGNFEILDVNNDGVPDVLFNLQDGHVYLSLGDGTGNFLIPVVAVSSGIPLASSNMQIFALGDLNGDGKPDIVTYSTGAIETFLNHGDGTFSPWPVGAYATSFGGYFMTSTVPAVVDYDGDGKADVIAPDDMHNTVAFYSGNGDGTLFGGLAIYPAAGNPGTDPPNLADPANLAIAAGGDINGDGLTDLIAYDFTNGPASGGVNDIVSLLSDGKGGFKEVVGIPATYMARYSETAFSVQKAFVDLNGDGIPDLLLIIPTRPTYTLAYAPGNGDGSFGTPVRLDLGVAVPCPFTYSDAGDLNGDGTPDLVVGYPGDASCYAGNSIPSGVFVLLNDGHGNFQTSFVEMGTAAYQPKLTDFDADGKLDLALVDLGTARVNRSDAGNAVLIAPGNGDGTFGNPISVISNYPLNYSRPSSVLTDDYNGDGKPDLTILSFSGVILIPNKGNFVFGSPTTIGGGLNPAWAGYGDFNGDGRPDLAVVNYYPASGTTGLSILPNLGAGIFGPAVNVLTPTEATYLFVGDFNGDGAPDIAVNGNDLTNNFFLNRGGDSIALTMSPSSPSQGEDVTITARLNTTFHDQVPSGPIAFFAGGALLGTENLAGGTAVITTHDLPIGENSITAKFAGDGNFNQAQATASVTVTALAPAITLTANPASVTVKQGQTGVTSLIITANSTFSGTVDFSCAGAPAESSCTINPASAILTPGQSTTVSAVIATTPPNSSYQAATTLLRFGSTAGFGFFAILLVVPIRRRTPKIRGALMMLFLFGTVAAWTGCGGSSHPTTPAPTYGGTQTGSYTLTVTATSGSVSQSVNVTLSVGQ
jgi:hypothetical protein